MYNRNVIVVRPATESLILHGVRDMKTLRELEPEKIAEKYGYECVPTYHFTGIDQILTHAKTLNPIKSGTNNNQFSANISEGYVVRDRNFQRIKVKSPAYVALSHLSVK